MFKMHVSSKFAYLCILMLFVNICQIYAASVESDKSTAYEVGDNGTDEDADYYDYTDDKSTDAVNVQQKEAATTTSQPEHTLIDITTEQQRKPQIVLKGFAAISQQTCPKTCVCNNEEKSVTCSRQKLEKVPENWPTKLLTIDLSYNLLTRIEEDAFSNCSKVREINLSYNQIFHIHIKAFNNLPSLQRLRLDNNKLTEIDANLFIGCTSLVAVNLSSNHLALGDQGSFLNLPHLRELSCQNCSWTTLYDDTFKNVSKLTALRLDHNDFGNDINTEALAPLKHLIELRLPELDKYHVEDLCNLLPAIDTIQFRHFAVSCFELVSGTSFDESKILVTEGPQYTIVRTTTKRPALQPREPPVVRPSISRDMNFTSSNLNASTTTVADIEKLNFTLVNATSATPIKSNGASEGTDVYQVPVSEATIKIMLISIMIIAFVGILIGIVCRKDVGGIKTKCCRTRKPEVKDPVHPTEEVPLNTLA